jgi:predicted phage terminase large subunit-like protein
MPLVDNWHVGAICEHLEAVSSSQIQRLLINVPPGHAKSLLVSVFWPAWVWATRPSWRGIFSSYAGDLAIRDSVRCRSLIEDDWYRSNFQTGRPGFEKWSLSSDQNVKSYFRNTRTGERMSLSVGGKATGFRGDCVVVDDPLNAKEAMSKLARDEAIYWWDKVMSSRLNDMAKGARVIIMQRLHENDLSGHVLRQNEYEHLCLPSEFNSKRRSQTYIKVDGEREPFWQDPRTEDGELLFPKLFSQEVLKQAKKDLGSDGYSGQHDQAPSPAEGGMFKRKWWRFWKPDGTSPECKRPDGCYEGAAVTLPAMQTIIISLDAAFKDKPDSDYVVFTVWGVDRANRYLLDMVRGKLSFTNTCIAFEALAKKWPRARKKIVEDKANGSAIIDTLQSRIAGIVAVNPEGGKEARASAVQPQIESGNVYIPEGAQWLEDFVEEFASFPLGANDDIVDSTSQALLELAGSTAMARARGLANL